MVRMVLKNRGVVQGTICGVSSPYGVAVSNSGEVVVSEYYDHCILLLLLLLLLQKYHSGIAG